MDYSIVIQIGYVILLALAVYFYTWLVGTYFKLWKKALSLFGFRHALKLSSAELHLRLNGSFFQILSTATPIGFLFTLGIIYFLFTRWNGYSLDIWLVLWLWSIPMPFVILANQFLPPAAIYLASSGPRSLRFLDSFRAGTYINIVSFLEETELAPVANLRTRHGRWEAPVLNMIHQVPLVFIDTRTITIPLLKELQWLLQFGYCYKTIFIIDDNGNSPLLESWLPDWRKYSNALNLVPANNAHKLLLSIIKDSDSLPKPKPTSNLPLGNLPKTVEKLIEQEASTQSKKLPRRYHWFFLAGAGILIGSGFVFGKVGAVVGFLCAGALLYFGEVYLAKRNRKLK
jgi:hypothetical protein